MNKEDLIARPQVYSQEAIDQMVLTPEGKATLMTKKVPNMVREPVYLLDEKGQKIPFLNAEGQQVLNEKGEMQYIIKDYVEVQHGWRGEEEILPATEPLTIDLSTSNLSAKAVNFVTTTLWRYNYFLTLQRETNEDYSVYLHKLRNDVLSVLNASKSYNSSTIQAIKTFINKVDSREFIDAPQEQKQGIWDKLLGGKPKERKPPEHKAAFT